MSNIHEGSNVSPAAPMAGEISFQGEQATAASPAANYANPAEAAFANGAFNESTAPQADAASVVTIRKPGTLTILIVVAGVCVVALGVYLAWLLLGASRAADLAALDRAVHEAEAPHLNAGFVAESDLGSLLDDIEGVARSSGEVRSHDRYGEHVTMELVDGSLYMYAAPLSSMTGANGEVGLVSLEATANPPDTQSGSGSTQLASWVLRVASEGGIAPTSAGVLSGEQVSLDALRSLGSNQMVLYMGRGGYTTKGGPFFTTGTKLTDGLRAKYVEDLEAKRLGISSDGFFVVLPGFFEAYYDEGALSGTHLVFISGGSLHDEKLADVLVGLGATTVTGFTESVGLDYCLKLIESMFGFDDYRGLLDYGQDGQRLTFYEAASNARAQAGKYDPTTKEVSLWTGTAPAEFRCYPDENAMQSRIPASAAVVVSIEPQDDGGSVAPVIVTPDDNPGNNDVGLVPIGPIDDGLGPYEDVIADFLEARDSFKATKKMNSKYLPENTFYEFDPDSDWGYALVDIGNDGIQELLITDNINNRGNEELICVCTLEGYTPSTVISSNRRIGCYLTADHEGIFVSQYIPTVGCASYLNDWNGGNLVEKEYVSLFSDGSSYKLEHKVNEVLVDSYTGTDVSDSLFGEISDRMSNLATDINWTRL